MDAQSQPNSEQEIHLGHTDVVRNYITLILEFISSYGWFLVFGGTLCVIVWSNVEPKIRKWKQKFEDNRVSAKIHKDPDVVLEQEESLQHARMRLQHEHDQRAAQYQEKIEQKEEEKRQARIEDWDKHVEGHGYRSKINISSEQKQSSNKSGGKRKPRLMQNDYNPLMGSSSGSSGPSRLSRFGGGGGG